MIKLIKEPQTARADGSVCRFSHAFNPVFYDFQRQDVQVLGIFNHNGRLALVLSDNSMFEAGKNAYVEITASNGSISGIFEVLDVINIPSIPPLFFRIIVLNRPFVHLVSASGFANSFARFGYNVVVRLRVGMSVSSERSFAADNNGVARCYINSILQDFFEQAYDLNYFANSSPVPRLSVTFRIEAKEQWVGSGIKPFTLFPRTFHAIKSVEQVGEDSRAVNWEVYFANALQRSTEAQFLTAFKKPVLFKGYPFSLGFLMGRSVRSVERVVEVGASQAITALPVATNRIHTLTVPTVAGVTEFNVWLRTGSPLSDSYANNFANNLTKTKRII